MLPLLLKELSNISISLSRTGFVANGVEESMLEAFSFSTERSDSHILQVWVFKFWLVCSKESVAALTDVRASEHVSLGISVLKRTCMQREKEQWLINCLLNVEAIAQKQSYGACLDCCPARFLAGWREQHNLPNEHGVLGRFAVQVSDLAQVTNVCLVMIQDCTVPCSCSQQWEAIQS